MTATQQDIFDLCLKVFKEEPLKISHLKGLSNQNFKLTFANRKFVYAKMAKATLFTEFQRSQLPKFITGLNRIVYQDGSHEIRNFIEGFDVPLEQAKSTKQRCLMMNALCKFNHLKVIEGKDFHVNSLLKANHNELLNIVNSVVDGLEPSKKQPIQKKLIHILHILEKAKPKGDKLYLSHNDFYYRNVLFDTEKNQYALIDFEYSNFNPMGYDIANFLNELMMDYEHNKFPFFKLDFDSLPSIDEIRLMVKFYVFFKDHGKLIEGRKEDEDLFIFIVKSKEFANLNGKLVEEIVSQIPLFLVVINCFWFLWSLVYSTITFNEFSYIDFAVAKYEMVEKFLPQLKFD